MTVDDVFVEGDKSAVRWTVTGTHTGSNFLGVPATGKQIAVQGMDFVRYDGDSRKALERWGSFDYMGMLRQLDVAVPPPGHGGV